MSEKEVMEGRRAGIPESILGKMIQGYEITDKEKEVIRSKGKVYVLGYTKARGQIRIKPQLRNLYRYRREQLMVEIIKSEKIVPVESSVYRFTRKELKKENASDFKHGDTINIGKYIIYIKYREDSKVYKKANLLSYIEDRDTFEILDTTPGVAGGTPYYLDNFLHR